ncbi:MAG: ABC transporter substrate binding protein [Desulfobulbaceae bacterium]|nr:ABC transporter substrate binding protein [Desulfobulbaceae bacterium]
MNLFLFKVSLAITLICCFPQISLAQFRIGVIMSGDVTYYNTMHEAFVDEFNKLIPAGEQVEIILQRPFPDPISWSNAARKLIAFDVDLIVTYGSPATHSVINEKTKIPVIYAGFYDPEGAVPTGKNMTGCGFKVPLSSLLRYLKRLKEIKTLRIIFSGVEEDSVRQSEEINFLAQQQGLQVNSIDIRTRGDLVKINTITQGDAVFFTGSSLVHLWMNEIISIIRHERVTSADIFPDITEEGVLMTLYQPAHEQGQMAAEMAVQILKGEQARNIRPEIFRDTELVFNLIEAREIGISFPIQLIIEATRVIQ